MVIHYFLHVLSLPKLDYICDCSENMSKDYYQNIAGRHPLRLAISMKDASHHRAIAIAASPARPIPTPAVGALFEEAVLAAPAEPEPVPFAVDPV
jgi:hypothetical protein